jgi:hypothetical protein
MKASIVETFRWVTVRRLRGLVIDGLPGLFVIDLDDIQNSIDRELARYTTSSVNIVFKPKKDHNDPDEKRIVDYFFYSAWHPRDQQTIRRALEEAVNEVK